MIAFIVMKFIFLYLGFIDFQSYVTIFFFCSLQRASAESGQSDLTPQVGTLVCMCLWLYKLYRITLVSVVI